MTFKECYAICGFVLLIVVYSAEGDVIAGRDNQIGCSGSVILSTFDTSLTEQYSVSIPHDDTKMIRNRRKRRSIRERQPGDTKKLLKFEHVTLRGNCCWKVWSRARAGEPFEMTIPETKQPGWTIRAVQLVEDCTSNANANLLGGVES
jgi:hypothetical protein